MKRIRILALLVATVFIMSACSNPSKKIIGTWKYQETVLGVVTETTYVFGEDGKGTMSTVLDVKIDMTYYITDDKLTITTSTLGLEDSNEYLYKFSGDKLTLTKGDKTIELTKAD